jgi:hypothetical protein
MAFAVFAGKTAYINNKTNTGDHFSQGCYSQLSFSASGTKPKRKRSHIMPGTTLPLSHIPVDPNEFLMAFATTRQPAFFQQRTA